MKKKICVFCGSSVGENPAYERAAKDLGALIAKNNIELVYGGGKVGLMGALANAVLKNGGKATGVIPSFMEKIDLAHSELSELLITEGMHERKYKMYDLSDCFFVLPGGIGTIDEFAEILTWSQLSLHKKPCVLINTEGYFDDLICFLHKANEEKFLEGKHLELLIIEEDINAAFERVKEVLKETE